ncbi:MAG: hypothetical protein GY819_04495 [Planctomycetaceae bacterium]|nr:hypothetical protein [Planctomycetaceae bacterium]MCP4462044.1 hypothetical protein [Planctomycetaceae bacterium]MDG1807986.1 hypothetical protein [Pirellulaceae bacterium]MDG2105354.1 hypothetical protein [Pirellulaceae bacterium]
MAFFNSGPNLPDDEKARIEFHLQQIVDCIGQERTQLPVLSTATLMGMGQGDRSVKDIAAAVGQHLSYPAGEIKVQVIPELLKKVGSGG